MKQKKNLAVIVLAVSIVVMLLGKAFVAAEKKRAAASVVAVSVSETEPETAPGSAGKLKLYNVDPKTAAMIMAIVADKLQKPINELRFISIKEVDEV